MADSAIERLMRRVQDHESAGVDRSHAFRLADFEERIENWPAGWGDDFQAIVFGDFEPPNQELVFDSLEIRIDPTKLEGTVVKTAFTVLRARVKIQDRTVASVKDATRRLNLLIGVLSSAHQGAPIRWWSYITALSHGGIVYRLDDTSSTLTLSLIDLLPNTARRQVTAALYWMREPRGMLLEHHRTDQVAVFAGYWNAFECLVEACGIVSPPSKFSRSQKEDEIQKRLAAVEVVGPSQIASIYHEVVNPGFRSAAEHAIRTCAGDSADDLICNCFAYTPRDHSLYAIRNAINHGSVDIDDPETLMIIDSRFMHLGTLVFKMLRGVLYMNARSVASKQTGAT